MEHDISHIKDIGDIMNIFFNSRIYTNQSFVNALFGKQQKTTRSQDAGCSGTRDTLTISASGKEKLVKNTKGRIYDRNLLGGLYRENPVKSRNYEAVKSSKKWENVGNSYIIPALLLYRYSYI